MLKVYLAGPEVFLEDALDAGAAKRRLCDEFGFVGLYPLSGEEDGALAAGETIEGRIYRRNLALMAEADFGIFNLTPFRGSGADVGTVFELGMFVGLGKPVFGYSNDGRDMAARVREAGSCVADGGVLRDADGMLVEDFGGADNLMITGGLLATGFPMVRVDARGPEMFRDLRGFRACLEAARPVFGDAASGRGARR